MPPICKGTPPCCLLGYPNLGRPPRVRPELHGTAAALHPLTALKHYTRAQKDSVTAALEQIEAMAEELAAMAGSK